MKVLVLLTLFTIFQHTTATIDIHELANTAKTQLQSLQETAASEIKKLVDNIDPEKVKQLDVFHIIPKVTKKVTKIMSLLEGDSKVETLIFDPHQGERLSQYFQQQHGYRGKRLVSALGAGLPLPMLRRMNAA